MKSRTFYLYWCKNSFAYTTIFTPDCTCLLVVCISIFNSLSYLISSYYWTMLTCVNHYNLFDWCRQALVSNGSIGRTHEEKAYLIEVLFSLTLVIKLIRHTIVNTVKLTILIFMQSIDRILFFDWMQGIHSVSSIERYVLSVVENGQLSSFSEKRLHN